MIDYLKAIAGLLDDATKGAIDNQTAEDIAARAITQALDAAAKRFTEAGGDIWKQN